MEQLTSYLDMGGYAVYVWSSFGITAVVMIGLLVVSLRQARAREAELAALRAQPDGRRRRGAEGAGT